MSRKQMQTRPATVLCISGHDPSGGAGMQADIESIHATGAYANCVPSCLTVQTAAEFRHSQAIDPDLMLEMLQALWAAHPADAIKIGLLGNRQQVDMLSHWLADCEDRPAIVLDPVLRASTGDALADEALYSAIYRQLLPLVTLLTPNHAEALALTTEKDPEQAVADLLAQGCEAVLLTGGDEPGEKIENLLITADGQRQRWQHQKLPGSFHGTGCTLSAAITSYLAQGYTLTEACEQGQHFTQQAIANAIRPAPGPAVPQRKTLHD